MNELTSVPEQKLGYSGKLIDRFYFLLEGTLEVYIRNRDFKDYSHHKLF